ncbi:MAG: bacteriohemerythrin [Nitrosomonadales bacterium]|nr:bacteriohemerythrin [Nitrosomonadales bacterium]
MNKEEELLAIRNLVFELSINSQDMYDLDVLLERLLSILRDYPDLPLEERAAVVLSNPRGNLYQVAQFGMEPAWKTSFKWELKACENLSDSPIQSSLIEDSGAEGGVRRLLLLPLAKSQHCFGYTLLFAAPLYHPSEIDLDFLADIARALSSLVQRSMEHETLQVRDLELEDMRKDAIRSLGVASQFRDDDTGWHIMRMTNYAIAIAKAYGLPEEQRELLHIAVPMHDVGKIGIPDSILLKPGKLTPEEFKIMQTHTEIGVSILTGKDPMIVAARDIAGSHHEQWDGSGYPRGLAGEEIPLMARICAVADVFDALTSVRPYKKSWSVEDASGWVSAQAGKHFDPAIVKAFEAAFPEILRIRELYRDEIIDPNRPSVLQPIPVRENAWVEWHEDLSVGIDTIDEHHRYLFDLINDLFEVVSNKRGVREVARLIMCTDSYARVHFRIEEQMMQHFQYEGIHRQEQQHHAFEAKIREFYAELHDNPLIAQFDVLSYLRDWLIHHIRVEDAQLSTLVSSPA